MKAREIEKLVKAAGWIEAAGRGKGSHRVHFRPDRPGRIVIPWHGDKDLATGTVLSILRQAGLR